MIGGGNGTLFSEQFNCSYEVIDILATAHLALEVITETLALRNSAHEADSSRLKPSESLLPRLLRIRSFQYSCDYAPPGAPCALPDSEYGRETAGRDKASP